MHSLIIVTNLTLISDAGEDIRRTEKLVITWRRLAAAAHATDSQLIVQGTESMLQDASAWLTQEGIEKIWGKEYKQRKDFGYPPAKRIIKLLIDHTFEESTLLKEELKITLGLLWNVSDPFPVLYRSKTRRIRHVIHLSPPENLNSEQVIHCLQPFAKKAIIDLDPIALLR
jgi:primosomal protein N'